MRRKLVLGIVSTVLVIAVAAGLFMLWGLGRVTFDATVVDIGETWVVVEGLDTNDVNHRGRFTISADDASQYRLGQLVRVTASGSVLETDPASFTGKVRIKPLD